MIIVEIFPICDVCNEPYADTRFTTKERCRAHMRDEGWRRIGDKDVCRFCVEKLFKRKSLYE